VYNSEQFSFSPDYQGHFAEKLDEGMPVGSQCFVCLVRLWKELEVQFTSCEDLGIDIVLKQPEASFSSFLKWKPQFSPPPQISSLVCLGCKQSSSV